LLRLAGGESLLCATVRRVLPLFDVQHILVVTTSDQAQATRRELRSLGVRNVLVEPEPRNTAGAIAIAAAWAHARTGGESILAVMPADHYVMDERTFRTTVRRAMRHVHHGIVTIGIRPVGPETGFGYIRTGPPATDSTIELRRVLAFVEKPNSSAAKRYVRSSRYLWNTGMFFMTAERMRLETKRHLPRLYRLVERLIKERGRQGFQAVLDRYYATVEAISIDYGIIEKTQGIVVLPADFGWNDVGSWSALGELSRRFRNRDKSGNVLIGDVLVLDASDNVVVSDPGAPFVGAVGVHDLIIVASADGVLVIPRHRAQDVRKVVDALKAAHRTDLVDLAPKRASRVSHTSAGRQDTRKR
jgi:mannose-1-phosphate guanylyltransferase